MKKQVLFIQGGGNNGYEADKKLVTALERELGTDYKISYPEIHGDENAADFGWTKQLEKLLDKHSDAGIVVAHSFGASMLLKYFSEHKLSKKPAAMFLLATPYWDGKEEWQKGIKLKDDFPGNLPEDTHIFFYHCHDDEEIPFDNLTSYRHKLPDATFREIKNGGHQFEDGLGLVANDIKNL